MAEEQKERKPVPYDRFKDVIDDKNTANDDKVRAQQQADYWKDQATKNQAPQIPIEQTKRYEKDALQKKVVAEEITQTEAQTLLDNQFMEDVKKEAREGALEAVRAENFGTRQNSKFKAYQETHPDAFKPGSDQHTKLKAKFDELVADGLPSSKATELVALEVTLGSSDIPKETEKPNMSAGVGDSNLYGDEPVASTDGMPASLNEILTPRLKVYYKNMVDQGDYTWDQVAKEAKYVNPDKAKKYDLMYGSKRKRP